jgi:hypothetical protein
MKTLLITAESVVKYTPIKSGVDHDIINPKIEVTQDLVLAYVIGAPLLEKLQDVVDGGSDPGGVYLDLLENYVRPYLRWATAYNLLPDIAYSIDSGGIMAPTSNQGNGIFDGVMAIVKQNILTNSDGYKKLLMLHLCNFPNLYPEYLVYEQGKQIRTDNGRPFHGVVFY